jgi:hypothetical protein
VCVANVVGKVGKWESENVCVANVCVANVVGKVGK